MIQPAPSRPPAPFDVYPGSKGADGVIQRHIAMMPPHGLYVEAFLGNGTALRWKSPALASIGIDMDEAVIERWRQFNWPGLMLHHGDGIEWLERNGHKLPADALVYCDPPYMRSTRSKRRLYTYEMTDKQHARLLAAVNELGCSVMVCGYRHDLYDAALTGWHRLQYTAMTRGGGRVEYVWIKTSLASFHPGRQRVGANFRERERIKRKTTRWIKGFGRLPLAEQEVILAGVLRRYAEANGLTSTPPARGSAIDDELKPAWVAEQERAASTEAVGEASA